MDPDAITYLDENEAWAFLAERSFGRLALAVLGQPEIFPINYAVSDARLLFRTAEGTKLVAMVMDGHVAFEVDELSVGGATSVVVKGMAHTVETQAEFEALNLTDLHSWVPTLKYNLVVVEISEITGRRFRFGPEPELTPVM